VEITPLEFEISVDRNYDAAKRHFCIEFKENLDEE